MAFKVIIKKCKNPFRAASIVDEIVSMSGASREYVLDTLIKKDVCVKKDANKADALGLKNRFESIGANVDLIESNKNGESEQDQNRKEKADEFKITPDRIIAEFPEDTSSIDDMGKIENRDTYLNAQKYENDRIPVTQSDTIVTLNALDLPRGKARHDSDYELPQGGEYKETLITEDFKEDYIKELFRSLRTKIFMRLHGIVDKSLVVTSMEANVGKSTMSSNIAISIAHQNWKTVLIDGDLRRGMLHTYFDVDQRPGLSDFILSNEEVTEESLNSLIRKTHVRDLYLITSGKYTTDSSDLLTSLKFIKAKKLLSKLFDMVILDTPPIGAVADPVVVNDFFSRYIVVVKAGKTNITDLKKKLKEFPAVKKKILGLILNFATIDRIRSYYKNSKYY
jgi:capsular exopolysaccharide synthesis family protein